MMSNQHNSKLPSQQTRKYERYESPIRLSNSRCQIISTCPSLSFRNLEISSIDPRKLCKNSQRYSRNSTGSKPLEFKDISPHLKLFGIKYTYEKCESNQASLKKPSINNQLRHHQWLSKKLLLIIHVHHE